MKQLIETYTNGELLEAENILELLINKVKPSDVTDKELRIAVQSLQMANVIITNKMKKLSKDNKNEI